MNLAFRLKAYDENIQDILKFFKWILDVHRLIWKINQKTQEPLNKFEMSSDEAIFEKELSLFMP